MSGFAAAREQIERLFPRDPALHLDFCALPRPVAGVLRWGSRGELVVSVNLAPISRENYGEEGNFRAAFSVYTLEERIHLLRSGPDRDRPGGAKETIWLPPIAPLGRMHRRLCFGPEDLTAACVAMGRLYDERGEARFRDWERLFEDLAALPVIAYRDSDLPSWAIGGGPLAALMDCLIAEKMVPESLYESAAAFREESLRFALRYSERPEPLIRDQLYALGKLNQALDRLWPGPPSGQIHAFGRLGESRIRPGNRQGGYR